MWNSGSTVSVTESAEMRCGMPIFTVLTKVMPWVMRAPLGRPVVPEVYMMVERSDICCGTISAS